MAHTVAEALAGSLLGQALGDALGFVVEAQPPEIAGEYVSAWLLAGGAGERAHPRFPFGQYSDDTQLARELLRSFSDARGWQPSVFAARLAELFRDRRDVGAGRGTRSAALRLLMGVPWSESGTPAPYAGNGAVNLPEPKPSSPTDSVQPSSRRGSVGKLAPGMAAQIRDPETDALLSLHDTGMLWLRGPNVF